MWTFCLFPKFFHMEEATLFLLSMRQLRETRKELNALKKKVSSFLPKVQFDNDILTIENLGAWKNDVLEFGKHGVTWRRPSGKRYFPYSADMLVFRRDEENFVLKSGTEAYDMIRIHSWAESCLVNYVGCACLVIIINEYSWSARPYPVCFRAKIDAVLKQAIRAWQEQ